MGIQGTAATTGATLIEAQRIETAGMLAVSAVHDFRNLLTAMNGGLQALTRSGIAEASREDITREMFATLAQGHSLVQQLLSLSRHRAQAHCRIAVTDVLENLLPLLKCGLRTGQNVRIDVAPDLPQLFAGVHGLERVIVNLVANARDALPHDGHVLIEVDRAGSLTGEREFLRICVTDNGAGMAPEMLAHATELFFTTKPDGVGTGIGLWSVRRFVESMGGDVILDSIPGRGTRIELWLPASPLAHPSQSRATPG
jgi:signal transduction histidine kinase